MNISVDAIDVRNLSKKTQIIDRSFKAERLTGCRQS